MALEVKSIPNWMLIVSGLFCLLGLSVSLTLIISPQAFLKSVDLHAKGVDYLIYMWAARQVAAGFIFGYATIKKSASMLILAYLFFLVMNIADSIIGVMEKDKGLVIGAIFMCIISSTMIFLINKLTK